ncbi:unnamed protein product [Wickerhamomyces anomalus]
MSGQIDLENLFSDPKNMPEFIPDYSIDEIDQALNDALAEIDQNHPNLEETQRFHTIKSELITPASSECNFKSEKTLMNNKERPLSPESFLSDSSVLNSPLLESKSELDQSQVYESIASIKSQIISSHNSILTYQTLKNAYQTKCKDLDKVMKELKKSEMLRLKLMEENKHLKKIVTSSIVNENAIIKTDHSS